VIDLLHLEGDGLRDEIEEAQISSKLVSRLEQGVMREIRRKGVAWKEKEELELDIALPPREMN
jgi:hypothetical protein